MTSVPDLVSTVRSYRSVSWLTSTAETASGWVLPVLVSVDSTFSPGLRLEIGAVEPSARTTSVSAVNDWPPQDAPAPNAPNRAPVAAASPKPEAEQSEAARQEAP